MAASGSVFGLRTVLSRHGVDPARGLRQLVGVAYIESIALRLIGLPIVPRILSIPTRKARITLGPGFQIDANLPTGRVRAHPLLAFDTGNEVALANVTELSIENAPEFTDIVLFLNGHEFLRRRRVQGTISGNTLRFALEPAGAGG